MKRVLLAIMVAFLMCAGCFTVTDVSEAKEYTYTVRIFAGAQGTFKSGDVIVYKNLHANDKVVFNRGDVKLKNGKKYYVSGIRESGIDNYDPDHPQLSTITVTGDADYVVAYGIRGKSVKYTVNYVDNKGNKLHESESFYGNEGDAPVVAFRYIDGYYPQAYNLTKTLTADASKNVFDFVYHSTTVGDEIVVQDNDNNNAQNNGAQNNGAQAGAAVAANGTVINNAATPLADGPADLVNLDDNSTPMADNSGSGIGDNATPKGIGATGMAIGIVALLAAAAAAAGIVAYRRRKQADE